MTCISFHAAARKNGPLYIQGTTAPTSDLASAVGLEPSQVERVYEAIEAKRAASRYLRTAPLLVRDIAEV
jgi:hypothetical protein